MSFNEKLLWSTSCCSKSTWWVSKTIFLYLYHLKPLLRYQIAIHSKNESKYITWNHFFRISCVYITTANCKSYEFHLVTILSLNRRQSFLRTASKMLNSSAFMPFYLRLQQMWDLRLVVRSYSSINRDFIEYVWVAGLSVYCWHPDSAPFF